MPATKRPKPIYQRGRHRLYERDDRPNFEIVWYDPERKRERSTSAGTSDAEAARAALDRHYLARTKGEAFCPTCGQRAGEGGVFVTTAIADYLTLASDKTSIGAIKPRLNHVLTYLVATDQAAIKCDRIDERWIEAFRGWLTKMPIVSPRGTKRPRALSTVEASVHQLSAAINRCGGTVAGFRALQPKEVNQTPTYRADVPMLAKMFRYCLYPSEPRRVQERGHLLAFLRLSLATLARPDAAHDFSTDPTRRQWNADAKVISLNPARRKQTRKYRATVPAARQLVPVLQATEGMLIPISSVRSAWDKMAKELGLPGAGAAGMKLIRRSMADAVRQRLPQEAWGELEVFMGHRRFDATTDLYAPFRPDYLRRALAAIERIIDEIEKACTGAFYRAVTADAPRVSAIRLR